MTTVDRIISCLEQAGIFLEVGSRELDFTEDEVDSLSFMSFIINLENEFNIVVPDYMVNYESFKSLESVAMYIDGIMKQNE